MENSCEEAIACENNCSDPVGGEQGGLGGHWAPGFLDRPQQRLRSSSHFWEGSGVAVQGQRRRKALESRVPGNLRREPSGSMAPEAEAR